MAITSGLPTNRELADSVNTAHFIACNQLATRASVLGGRDAAFDDVGLVLSTMSKFRRIKGYQEILLLKERLNPSRIQQKEVRTVEVA